jgi:hypothetical protein
MTNPQFGENLPPEKPKERKPVTTGGWVVFAVLALFAAALLAPLVIWLWRLALGLI